MLVFAIIGAIGLLVLLVSLVVDEVIELGDGAISGTSLGAGAVAFGAIGAIVTVNGLPTVWAYVASAVLAAVVMVGTQRVIARLRDSEDGIQTSSLGLSGVVTSTVTAAGGEVSIDGELERRLAWSDSELSVGARVVVVEQAGSRVKVAPPSTAAPTERG